MGYTIAAYVVVIGSLVAYGLWIHSQRRALARRAEAEEEEGGRSDPP